MLTRIVAVLRRFWTETRGAVTVEFVIAMPLLMAVLAFSTQYGRAMQARAVLDVAVRDAARLLSRAPVADPVVDSTNAAGQVPEPFIDVAELMIINRLGTLAEEVRFTEITADTQEVTIAVEIDVEFPFLSAISFGENDISEITMTANEVWPRAE